MVVVVVRTPLDCAFGLFFGRRRVDGGRENLLQRAVVVFAFVMRSSSIGGFKYNSI